MKLHGYWLARTVMPWTKRPRASQFSLLRARARPEKVFLTYLNLHLLFSLFLLSITPFSQLNYYAVGHPDTPDGHSTREPALHMPLTPPSF